jgi:hypothetical protein
VPSCTSRGVLQQWPQAAPWQLDILSARPTYLFSKGRRDRCSPLIGLMQCAGCLQKLPTDEAAQNSYFNYNILFHFKNEYELTQELLLTHK